MSHPLTTNNSIPRELNRVFLSPFSLSFNLTCVQAHPPIEWQMFQRYEWMSFHFEFTSPSHYHHRLHKTIWKVSLPHPLCLLRFGAFDLFSLYHSTGKPFSSKQWLIHKIFVPAVDVCAMCGMRCVRVLFDAYLNHLSLFTILFGT